MMPEALPCTSMNTAMPAEDITLAATNTGVLPKRSDRELSRLPTPRHKPSTLNIVAAAMGV